jgi:kumamolisin
MRNLAELEQRIANREILSLDEMSAKYFPAIAEIERVRSWLVAQGFEVLPAAPHELSVFARWTITQLQQVFGVTFARVQFAGEEHTSALSAPSLPLDIAGPVLSINGLQPHLHPFVHFIGNAIGPGKSISNSPPYLVPEIAKAYDATLGNGMGQKIGIVIDTFPSDSDLSAFWADNSVTTWIFSMLLNDCGTGTLPSPSGEETLDASWTSGIASGAGIRIYATTDLHFTNLDQAYQRIINDLPSQPGLRQISLSYGLGELYEAPAQIATDAQYFATLAAGGVTVFVSSGDGGGSPGMSGHGQTGPIQVEAPADDPHVTAVGGTSLFLNSSTGAATSETAWFDGGGGQSVIFSRPPWQPSSALIPGSNRLVPDVALAADPSTGAFLVLDGGIWQIGGTSWSAPVWAGFCARLNQIRAGNGGSPVALLGPSIYPFVGSTLFRDITSGSNGVYNAGPGFDLCTGAGVPQIDILFTALSHSQPFLPEVAKDFNRDGFADLLFEHSATGNHMVWLLKDGVLQSSFALSKSAPQWHIADVGDFLGNGQPSLVLENTITGSHKIRIVENGAVQYQIWLPLNRAWHVGAAADFDGDGQADLAMENINTGARRIWFLKGTPVQRGTSQVLPILSETVNATWFGKILKPDGDSSGYYNKADIFRPYFCLLLVMPGVL